MKIRIPRIGAFLSLQPSERDMADVGRLAEWMGHASLSQAQLRTMAAAAMRSRRYAAIPQAFTCMPDDNNMRCCKLKFGLDLNALPRVGARWLGAPAVRKLLQKHGYMMGGSHAPLVFCTSERRPPACVVLADGVCRSFEGAIRVAMSSGEWVANEGGPSSSAGCSSGAESDDALLREFMVVTGTPYFARTQSTQTASVCSPV